jgi:peptide/nickel transport system permease protein
MKIRKALAIAVLSGFILCGIFSDFIANDKAVIAEYRGKILLTPFYKNLNSNELKAIVNPLIKYSYHHVDNNNMGAVSPFEKQVLDNNQQRHFLGTDIYGRDILAGLVHGSSIALLVGFGSMVLALVLGLLISLIPSYTGDNGFKLSFSKTIVFAICLLSVIYILFYRKFIFSELNISAILALILGFLFFVKIVDYFTKKYIISVPLDSFNIIFTSLFQSIPASFIVLILINLFAPASVLNIIVLIGILKWPVFSRYIRAEVLKIKEERFIESSKLIGLSESYILIKHIIPHIITPLLVAFSYGFVSTVLLESTLSFLGIGIPIEHISWGTILGEARNDISAWWLAVFPGLLISTVIISINYLAGLLGKSMYGNQNF